jgi:hypothetical protein
MLCNEIPFAENAEQRLHATSQVATVGSATKNSDAAGHGNDSAETRPMAAAPPISIAGFGRR